MPAESFEWGVSGMASERVEKTVFISYRRTNFPWAMAIYQYLVGCGYDVFLDYTGIGPGDFEQVILANIRGRAHFLVLLTPSALERCDEPGDWLRREIEEALDFKRNIIPIFLEDFDFDSPCDCPAHHGQTGAAEALQRVRGADAVLSVRYEGSGRKAAECAAGLRAAPHAAGGNRWSAG
jgi:hypothetical protein